MKEANLITEKKITNGQKQKDTKEKPSKISLVV